MKNWLNFWKMIDLNFKRSKSPSVSADSTQILYLIIHIQFIENFSWHYLKEWEWH